MVEKLWETNQDKSANLVSVLSDTIEERLPEKELNMFDQIAQGLKKYTWPQVKISIKTTYVWSCTI